MGKKIKILQLMIIFFSLVSYAQTEKIGQKKGAFQNNKAKHISFHNFIKYNPRPNEPAIGRARRISIYNNKVFVLDERLCRLYVFDNKAHYLFSIGRPGQGPGDLEFPRDFSISERGEIYILNSRGKQIEIFTQAGKFIKRLIVDIPNDYSYSQPRNLIVFNEGFFIGYHLSPSYIDEYNLLGKYQRTLFKRTKPIFIPGYNVANSSEISLIEKEKAILHFNYFTGVFSQISISGIPERNFSAFVERVNTLVSKQNARIRDNLKKKRTMLECVHLHHWSNFCIDEKGYIYILSLLSKQTEGPELYAFSESGVFLYRITIPYFKGTRIKKFTASGKRFAFITEEEELIYATKKGG